MLSAKEAARELGTDARTFRKFMRATLPKDDQPGQGNRYQIDPDEVTQLRKSFKKWTNGKAPAEPKPEKKSKKSKEVEETDDPDDFTELHDPSEEELDDLLDDWLDIDDLDIEELE